MNLTVGRLSPRRGLRGGPLAHAEMVGARAVAGTLVAAAEALDPDVAASRSKRPDPSADLRGRPVGVLVVVAWFWTLTGGAGGPAPSPVVS